MLNPLDLHGRRILVTGAASGIGLVTCQLLAELGATINAVDIDVQALHQVFASLSGEGHSAFNFDLLKLDEIPSFMVNVVEQTGPLFGVVHCAGKSSVMPARLLTKERYRDVFAINTEAALALSRGFQQRKVCLTEGGSIVFISSVMGIVGSVGATAYAMSKAALGGLTKSLALEFAPRRIRVNCVAPGYVRTQMYERLIQKLDEQQRLQIEIAHPLGLGEPIDVANAVAFLLADTGRWITGSTLVCDGGYTSS